MAEPGDKTTDFGFEKVSFDEKARRVAGVFHSVAEKYDLMNDLMSFGIHRLWKRFTLQQTGLRHGGLALDVAGGTGDITLGLAKQVGRQGRVILTDINASMLTRGRDRIIDQGAGGTVLAAQANAECLPFRDQLFDCVVISFGLRNVPHKDQALRSMYRVLKPGGRLLILEFSKPVSPALNKLYDLYSFSLLPRVGRLVTGDADSYRYLAESIRMHPDQEALKTMMEQAGFERCRYYNLSAGIVALHKGYRL